MNNLPVIMRTHELSRAVGRISEKLPSLKRQTIGRRVEDKTLELMELLIMAKNAPKAMKAPYLIKATAANKIVDFHLRSILEEKLINETTIHQLLTKNAEIGRMIGGWRKSVQ
jgi:hypothetical protein